MISDISISISIGVDDDDDYDNVEDDDDSTFLTRFLLDLLGGFLFFFDGFVGTDDRTLGGREDGSDDTKFVVGAVIMIMVTMVTMVTMMAMMMMLLGYYRY